MRPLNINDYDANGNLLCPVLLEMLVDAQNALNDAQESGSQNAWGSRSNTSHSLKALTESVGRIQAQYVLCKNGWKTTGVTAGGPITIIRHSFKEDKGGCL